MAAGPFIEEKVGHETAQLGIVVAPNNYDFVLHYLTERSGIPRDFTQMPFGLETATLGLVPHQTFDQQADLLKTLDYPSRLDTPCFQLQTDSVLGPLLITSAACANSTYPTR